MGIYCQIFVVVGIEKNYVELTVTDKKKIAMNFKLVSHICQILVLD